MKNWIIQACCRAVCATVFFFLFSRPDDLHTQIAFVGALLITAVYFDSEKWELK